MTLSNPDLDEVTPARIRELRENLKISQQDFGPLIGFAPGPTVRMRVSAIETGRKPIHRQTALIVLYLEAFGPLDEKL